ncbi:MAG: transposase [Kordiimonadaceae bacterium]|nr:transposase [Kordiimonadaceae bacterium]
MLMRLADMHLAVPLFTPTIPRYQCTVQAPGTGKTKTGRIWTRLRYERDWQSNAAPAFYYRYSADRKGARPQDHLKDY